MIDIDTTTSIKMELKENLLRKLTSNMTTTIPILTQATFIEMNILGIYRISEGHYKNLQVPEKLENLSQYLSQLLGCDIEQKSNTVIAECLSVSLISSR